MGNIFPVLYGRRDDVHIVPTTTTVFPDAILAVFQIRPAAHGGKKRIFSIFATICIPIYYKNVKIFFCIFSDFFVRFGVKKLFYIYRDILMGIRRKTGFAPEMESELVLFN